MRKFVLSAVAVALLAVGGVANATSANLVTNGDFETGTFAGWTLSGNTGFNSVQLQDVSHGYVWSNGAVGATLGQISQNVSTITGATYTLSFDLRENSSTPNKMKVSFGSDPTELLIPFLRTNYDYPSWTHFTVTGLVADGTSSLLRFGSRNDPGFNYIDNITLTAAVPEPESYAMLLAGLGLMGTIARRRSNKSKAV